MFSDKRKPLSHIDTEAWHINEINKIDIKERIEPEITADKKIKYKTYIKINGKVARSFDEAIKILNDTCKEFSDNL